MSYSELISLAGILISLFVSIVSIAISVKSLKQNSRMIEASTRPYITVYGNTTCFQEAAFFIVLKNFGKTGAVIEEFETNYDLSEFDFCEIGLKPFENIVGTFIAPNQSFRARIDIAKVAAKTKIINFSIRYSVLNKTYSEKVSINIPAFHGMPTPKAATKGENLKIISFVLQDFVEKQL